MEIFIQSIFVIVGVYYFLVFENYYIVTFALIFMYVIEFDWQSQ